MIRRVLLLVVGSILFVALAALPVARLTDYDQAFLHASTAMVLCLIPGVLTLIWASWMYERDPQQQLLVMLGATGIRMFGVLIVGYLLYTQVPPYRDQLGFLLWLVVCYVFVLALELILLLSGQAVSSPLPSGGEGTNADAPRPLPERVGK